MEGNRKKAMDYIPDIFPDASRESTRLESFVQRHYSSYRRRPVSRKPMIMLDSRLRGNDNITGFMQFFKGLLSSEKGRGIASFS